MKTGIGQIEAVSVACPECGEIYCGKSGSQLLTVMDAGEAEVDGWILKCFGCGKKFRAPAILKRLYT